MTAACLFDPCKSAMMGVNDIDPGVVYRSDELG